MRRPSLRFAVVAALTSAVFATSPAGAYCRTTTCDVQNPPARCVRKSAAGCWLDGAPIFWNTRCLWFGTQKDGSQKLGITWEKTGELASAAFEKWGNADCGGGTHPSFRAWDMDDTYGPVECDAKDYERGEPGANVYLYYDEGWPYDRAVLALTTVSYDTSTGELHDADVEINSTTQMLTTTDDPEKIQVDLESLITHETGHFLGLAHSDVASATMSASYTPGTIGERTLDPDDETGICAIYPADRDVPQCSGPEPEWGYSLTCSDTTPLSTVTQSQTIASCSCRTASGPSSSVAPALGLFAALLLRARRRSARRHRASPQS